MPDDCLSTDRNM